MSSKMCDISPFDESIPNLSSDATASPSHRRGLDIAGSLAASCARPRTNRRQQQQQQQQHDSPTSRFLPPAGSLNEDRLYSEATVSDLLQLLQHSTVPHLARFRDFLLDKKARDQSGDCSAVRPQRQPLMLRNGNSNATAVPATVSAVSKKDNKSAKKKKQLRRAKTPSPERVQPPPTLPPPPPTPPSPTRLPPPLMSSLSPAAPTPQPPLQQQQPRRSTTAEAAPSGRHRRSASYPALLNDLASSIRSHLSRRSNVAMINAATGVSARSCASNSDTSSITNTIDLLDDRAGELANLLDKLAAETVRLNAERQRLSDVLARYLAEQQQQQQQQPCNTSVACQTDLAWSDMEQNLLDEREQYALQIEYLNYELNQLSERLEQSEFDRLEMVEQRKSGQASARAEIAVFEERLREMEAEAAQREAERKELAARYYECKYRADNCEFLMSLRDTKLNSICSELQSAARQIRAASAAAIDLPDGASDRSSAAEFVADTCERLCQQFSETLDDGLRSSVLQMCAEVKRS